MHEATVFTCVLVLPDVNGYYIAVVYFLELPVIYIIANATNWLYCFRL